MVFYDKSFLNTILEKGSILPANVFCRDYHKYYFLDFDDMICDSESLEKMLNSFLKESNENQYHFQLVESYSEPQLGVVYSFNINDSQQLDSLFDREISSGVRYQDGSAHNQFDFRDIILSGILFGVNHSWAAYLNRDVELIMFGVDQKLQPYVEKNFSFFDSAEVQEYVERASGILKNKDFAREFLKNYKVY